MNFSPEKLLLVGIIALVVLGPNRLPQAARTAGRFLAEFRRLSANMQKEVTSALAEPRDALHEAVSEFGLSDVRSSIRNTFAEVVNGTVVKGTVVNGTVVNGAAVNGAAVNDTVVNDTVVNDTVVNDTVGNGTVVNGTPGRPETRAVATRAPIVDPSIPLDLPASAVPAPGPTGPGVAPAPPDDPALN